MATATQPQTGAPAPVRGGVTPYPKSSPGRFGPFRLQQLVLLQIAVAALLVAWVVEPLLLVPAGVLALVLVVLAVVRRHQRSLPEWIGGALALRSRRRRAASFAVPAGTEPGLAPLVEADPALRTLTFSDRDRRPVGMVGDGTFLTAVVQVDMDATALRPDRGARPLPWPSSGTSSKSTASGWSPRNWCSTPSPRRPRTCRPSRWPPATTRRSRPPRALRPSG